MFKGFAGPDDLPVATMKLFMTFASVPASHASLSSQKSVSPGHRGHIGRIFEALISRRADLYSCIKCSSNSPLVDTSTSHSYISPSPAFLHSSRAWGLLLEARGLRTQQNSRFVCEKAVH